MLQKYDLNNCNISIVLLPDKFSGPLVNQRYFYLHLRNSYSFHVGIVDDRKLLIRVDRVASSSTMFILRFTKLSFC
jgi:hypothetical protein